MVLHTTDETAAGTRLIDGVVPANHTGFLRSNYAESTSNLFWLTNPYDNEIMYTDGSYQPYEFKRQHVRCLQLRAALKSAAAGYTVSL